MEYIRYCSKCGKHLGHYNIDNSCECKAVRSHEAPVQLTMNMYSAEEYLKRMTPTQELTREDFINEK